MKTSAFLCALICLVWFSSCRTTKETINSKTDINTETALIQSKTEELKTASVKVSDIVENVTEIDSSVIEQTTIQLSKPDSTGKQYVEKITTTTTTAGKTRKAEKSEISNLKQEAAKNSVENMEVTEKQVINSETQVKTKKKFPLWKVIPLIALLAGAVFLFWKFNTVWNR
jgi:predicted RND superfamily exporter protein